MQISFFFRNFVGAFDYTSKKALKDLFNIFLKNETVEVEELADYQVLLLDSYDPKPAMMAVTALTVYQLEHGYERGRFQMLLWAMSKRCSLSVRLRAIIGLLMICGYKDVRDEWALEQMADLLSYENEMAFDAWCTILMACKPETFDPNYAIMRPMYNSEPFTNSPEMYFQEFERGVVENIGDYEWRLAEIFFDTMNVCDSDKYVLMILLRQYLPVIVEQLKEQDIDLDALDDINLNFQQMMMISNGKDHLKPRKNELNPMENYVQQMYRFINASRHTSARLDKDKDALRKTMIDKMVVVGAEQNAEINAI